MSFETSFDSKQPKLEPKLVSALNETKRLFRLFRFYTETESFDVSIEPKQTEDQPKQFDREHIWLFFTENFGFFRFLKVFKFFSVLSGFETNRGPTQTVLKRVYLGNFRKFRVVSVCFGLFRFVSVCFGLFQFVSVCYETVLFVSVVSI